MGELNIPAGDVPFWERPLAELDRGQWEALCDGCGKCCLHKLEDDDTGEIYPTDVACRLLDLETVRCADYRRRRFHVPDCLRLSRGQVEKFNWLPDSCAYVLRARELPLPEWHHLVCGDPDRIHAVGASVRGRVISEDDIDTIEDHVLETPL